MNGPQRLLETEGGSLVKALEQARGRVADDAKLARIADGLARQGVPVDPSAIPASAGAAPAAWSLGAKVFVGALGVLALVALGTLLRPGSNPIASKTAPPSETASGAIATTATTVSQPGSGTQPRFEQTPQPAGEPGPGPDGPAAAPEAAATSHSAPLAAVPPTRPPSESPAPRAEPAPAQKSASLAAGERPQTKPSGAPSSPAAQTPGSFREPSAPAGNEEEIALLKEARAALTASPAQALALTERHRADYPRGSLVQEREVIAITALSRLGQTSSARQRADRFRSNYPRSAYLKQIDRVLGDR